MSDCVMLEVASITIGAACQIATRVRLEQLSNSEGAEGWELVAINEERATFKRRLSRSR